ncbi:carbon monoxide dehydrogenase G protein [Bradyrhizobiaceae bacterium SG-6C]|nr:carbon monoxide dehydrogenase G protein [Bradyrhizobiaceae bacterium SG-6C]
MKMAGQQRIPASRDVVWKALNDPAILEACIPGCQELVKLSDTQMTATAVIKVGPVSAKFQGAVTLSDLDPPNGYRITGEGQGGVAGFAKGGAVVRLEADGDATLLHYDVSAEIGGKLSQLGGRLIDATAKQMSAAFFKRFALEIERQYGKGNATHASAGIETTSARPAAEPDRQAARRPYRPEAETGSSGFPGRAGLASLLALALLVGAGWYFFGGGLPKLVPAGSNQAVSPDFASAVVLLIVAAIGYLFGRLQTGRH